MNKENSKVVTEVAPTGLALKIYQWKKSLRTVTPYLMFFGVFLWIATYYLFVEGWELPRFNKLPGPVEVITEWINPDPDWGISLFSPIYYEHIIASCRRIMIAFTIATCLGVPLGLFDCWFIFVGVLMVLIFMTLYYRRSGLIANVALVLNIFIGFHDFH